MKTINVLVTREDGVWVTVGLEHFLMGSGPTPDEALRDIEQQFEMQEIIDRDHGQEPFEMVPPAPEKYWKIFDEARLQLSWRSQESPT